MENCHQLELDQLKILYDKLGLLSRTNENIRKIIKAKQIPKSELEEVKERFLEFEFWIEKCKLAFKDDEKVFRNLKLSKENVEKSNVRLKNLLKRPFPSKPIPQSVDYGIDGAGIGKYVSKDAEKMLQKKVPNQIPDIDPLSMEEFSAVPHYMKGRLTLEKINQFIIDFNKTIVAKYKILKTPNRLLSESQMRKVRAFKSQNCDKSYDLHFCTDEDLKDYSHLKIDNAARSSIVILRHCGRIRDIRNGSVVLHAILPTLGF